MDANLDTRRMVPCGLCGALTPMLGTERCDRCYELETRIFEAPELARKVLERMGHL
jgi:hypothetical protein